MSSSSATVTDVVVVEASSVSADILLLMLEIADSEDLGAPIKHKFF